MRSTRMVVLMLVLAFPSQSTHAQTDTTHTYRLSLTDGTNVEGRIVTEDSLVLHFRTLGGADIRVQRSSVSSLTRIRSSAAGSPLVRSDPNQTRLFFAPTARTLPSGSGYFSVYELFFPMIAVGAADWLTVAGGFSLVPGASSQILYVAPKARAVHTEHVDVSLGVLYIKIPEVTKGAGISYGVLTAGNPRAAFTFGLGWGFYGSDFGDAPSIVLGGEVQVSESIKLLSENWIPEGADAALLSFGVRFFGDHLAGDFGLLTTTEASDGFPFLPWVGFVYNF